MLSGLKDNLSGKRTDQLSDEVAELKKAHEDHSRLIKAIKDDLAGAAQSMKQFAEKQQKLAHGNSEAIKAAGELKQEVDQGINSLKIMSSDIQKNLAGKITEAVSDLAEGMSDRLSGIERLRKEMESTASSFREEMKILKEEISRLQGISGKIKNQDFELVKFTGQLKEAEDEKLKLMREVDSLQRLVSGLRRRR